jgi:hypothetical protein
LLEGRKTFEPSLNGSRATWDATQLNGHPNVKAKRRIS